MTTPDPRHQNTRDIARGQAAKPAALEPTKPHDRNHLDDETERDLEEVLDIYCIVQGVER